MRLVKELAAQIEDEVDGCCEYAKAALTYKVSRPELARVYYQLANTEYDHCTMLHDWVMRIIDEAENSSTEPPKWMRNKWQAKHDELVEKMAVAKTYISMYK